MRLVPTLVLATAALVGAAAASASVTPFSGSIGTSVVVDAENVGTKKPKCFLHDTATNKKIPLKVTAFTTNTVTVDVVTGYAGTFDLVVDTKDGTDETNLASFTIEIPAASSLSTATADPNATVTINGQFFGSKKPKVYVGGKKAKVTAFTDTTIDILVPKSLANGTYDVNLRNKIGEDTLGASLTVQNSAVGLNPIKGKEFISGSFGSVGFRSGGPGLGANAVTYAFQDLTNVNIVVGTSIAVRGTSVTNTTLQFSFAEDILDGTLPATVTATVATYNRTVGLDLLAYTATGAGGSFAVTIDKVVGGRAQGTFTGTMNKGAGNGPAQITVNGKFTADLLTQ